MTLNDVIVSSRTCEWVRELYWMPEMRPNVEAKCKSAEDITGIVRLSSNLYDL